MKRLIPLIFVMLVAGVAFGAGEPFTVQFTAASCQTNTTASVTNAPDYDGVISGFVDTIIVDQTGTATGTVSITTVSGLGTGASRTIMTDTSVSADGSYPVRDIVTTTAGTDISNVPARIPLTGDKLRLRLYNWGATNISMSVWVVVTPTP